MATKERPGAPVVVGVNESRAAQCALLWATREARLRRAALLIVHALNGGAGETARIERWAERARAQDLLATSAAVAARTEPSLPVATQLLRGEPFGELRRFDSTAAVVALGSDQSRGGLGPDLLAAPANRLEAAARCDVVLISAAYAPAAEGFVLIAWDGVAGAGLLSVAAAAAVRRNLSLRVLLASAEIGHGAEFPDLALTGQAAPRVDVEYLEPAAPVVEALLLHSVGADLVVVSAAQWGVLVNHRGTGTAVHPVPLPACAVMVVRRS